MEVGKNATGSGSLPGACPPGSYARLVTQSLFALLVCAAAVEVCYLFIDRPVAFFVHDHDLKRFAILKQFTYVPEIVPQWSPVALALLMVRRAWGPLQRCEWTLLAAIVSMLIAEQCRESLKFVFGRYWPDTWINNNPSLIRDDAYGFHPFHGGDWRNWYGSFPSGHTARSVGFAWVFWIVYPRWRWLCVLVVASVVAGLVGNNDHFVGDTIAGGVVGGIVGTYTARLMILTDITCSAA